MHKIDSPKDLLSHIEINDLYGPDVLQEFIAWDVNGSPLKLYISEESKKNDVIIVEITSSLEQLKESIRRSAQGPDVAARAEENPAAMWDVLHPVGHEEQSRDSFWIVIIAIAILVFLVVIGFVNVIRWIF